MQDSLFTKIIRGEIPSHKVYEDEHTLAFLDINPAHRGHTLVVPKVQVEFVWDLDAAHYDALQRTVLKVGNRLRDVIGTPYVGQLVLGTDVPHAHIHVIPFDTPSELKRAIGAEPHEPDHTALAQLAQELYFS